MCIPPPKTRPLTKKHSLSTTHSPIGDYRVRIIVKPIIFLRAIAICNKSPFFLHDVIQNSKKYRLIQIIMEFLFHMVESESTFKDSEIHSGTNFIDRLKILITPTT